MTHIERTVTIPAPVAEVFAYASDYRCWPEWFQGVSEFVPTTAITRGTGACYAYKARLFGMAIDVETEICDFETNKGWRGVSIRGVPSWAYWDFQAVGDSTRFVYTLEYQLPYRWISLLPDVLLVRPQWNRIIAQSLEKLKRHF